MKSLIAHQLPKKTDRVVFCQLTDVQRDSYERYLESEIVELVKRAYEPCDCGAKSSSGKPKTRGLCCYATLSDGETTWKVRKRSWFNLKILMETGPGFSDHDNSSEIIESLSASHPQI
jgi:SNF2 family DNA or RNA helicase